MHTGYTPTFIPYTPDGDPMYYVPSIMPPTLPSHQYAMTTYATSQMAPSSTIPQNGSTSNDSTLTGDNYATINEQLPYYPPYQTIYYQPVGRPQNGSYAPYWCPSPYSSTFIPGPPQNAVQTTQVVPKSSSPTPGAYLNNPPLPPPPPPNSSTSSNQ